MSTQCWSRFSRQMTLSITSTVGMKVVPPGGVLMCIGIFPPSWATIVDASFCISSASR